MSTRVITERELLHNLAFEVAELREHVAGLHTRLERFELVRAAPAIPIRCLLDHEHASAGDAVDCNREQAELERKSRHSGRRRGSSGEERTTTCSCGRKVIAS